MNALKLIDNFIKFDIVTGPKDSSDAGVTITCPVNQEVIAFSPSSMLVLANQLHKMAMQSFLKIPSTHSLITTEEFIEAVKGKYQEGFLTQELYTSDNGVTYQILTNKNMNGDISVGWFCPSFQTAYIR